VAAIPSNMAWTSATRKSRRWRSKARGIARPSESITWTGRRWTHPKGSGIARAPHLHETSFRKAVKANLKIVFGTDIGGIPWQDPIAAEFKWMVNLGMTPAAAIQAATSRPAEMLGSKGELGQVAEGAYADIIAVSADPLKDITELEKVKFVMKDGAVFKDDFPHGARAWRPRSKSSEGGIIERPERRDYFFSESAIHSLCRMLSTVCTLAFTPGGLGRNVYCVLNRGR